MSKLARTRIATAITLILAGSAALTAQIPGLPPKGTGPELTYKAIPNAIKLPDGLYLGEAAGVAVNSKGHIFIFARSKESHLFEFDQHGVFLREIGKGLYAFDFAHVVRIDPQDNIWCIDEGANMGIEFDPEGRILKLFGRKPETVEGGAPGRVKSPEFGDYATKLFNRPTDVAWDAEGNSYFADGYVNARVVKFDKNGDWVKAWGDHGSEIGQFNILHSIAVDAAGNVYVGDRENNRIQVFDGNGKFLRMFSNVGAPWALCITKGSHPVLFTSDSVPGRIYKLDLDGKILGIFGKPGKLPGEFGWVHEIACPTENELYVSEILNWRVQKIELGPAK